jgi:hypothetical protein
VADSRVTRSASTSPRGAPGKYEVVYVWVHEKFGAFMRIRGHDGKGGLVKEFQVEDVMQIAKDTWTLRKMQVATHDPASGRRISITDVTFDTPKPARATRAALSNHSHAVGWTTAQPSARFPRWAMRAGHRGAQRAAGVGLLCVNATCEKDWPQVAVWRSRIPDFVLPAFGIHPWKAHTALPGWQDRLLGCLETFRMPVSANAASIQWINGPSLDIQRPVFLEQLRIARETGRCQRSTASRPGGRCSIVLTNSRPRRGF